MKKIVLTGATGYIGSNLLKKLVSENQEVHIIVRETSKFDLIEELKDKIRVFVYDGNINSLISYFNNVKPDIVYHLASLFIAEHKSENLDNLIDSNIKFGTEILEAMSKTGVKELVNTGTSWQHFNNEKYNPVCLYAATKEAFERIIDYYVQVHNFKVITLKLFDTYGPNDNRPKILNLLGKYSANKTALRMSGGEQFLDLTYIDDVIEGFYEAMLLLDEKDYCSHEKYALYGANRYKLKDIISIYENVTGNKILVEWGAREYRKREVMIPCSIINKLPNWDAHIDLEEGLKLMNNINPLEKEEGQKTE